MIYLLQVVVRVHPPCAQDNWQHSVSHIISRPERFHGAHLAVSEQRCISYNRRYSFDPWLLPGCSLLARLLANRFIENNAALSFVPDLSKLASLSSL